MEPPTTQVLNTDSVPRSSTPLARAIDVTVQMATSWVGAVTAYAGAVAGAIIAFQKLSLNLSDWPGWARVILVSTLPIAVLVFHTIPTLVDQRRKKRLGEISGTLQTGYFRLAPREDETAFSRADGKHEEILKWLGGRDQVSILYLTGASGSGKTSLLTAWVLPHLERHETHVIRLRGYQDPLGVLEEELKKPGIVWRRPGTGKVDLKALVLAAAHHLEPKRMLIVLDQFEEFVILQNEERQRPFEEFVSTLRNEAAVGLTFLFVFRSDYIGMIETLSLPPLVQDGNWKEIPPFTERAAQEFMRGSGLQVSDDLLREVLREAAEIEQTKGLIRPVTLNLCGLVLGRFASGLPRSFRSRGLIRSFLRESVLSPFVQNVSTQLIPQMITNYVTKRPRTITELAQDSGVDVNAVRGCLRLLGQSDRAIVRPIDVDQQTWEISHDFLVPLLDSIMARWKLSLWRRMRAWVPWIATAALAIIALSASLWKTDTNAIVELTQLGWTVTKTSKGLELTFPSCAPGTFKASLPALRKAAGPLIVNLTCLDNSISDWSVLSNLTELRFYNGIVSDLRPLQGFNSLSSLNLRNTQTSSLEPLKDLKNLSTLDLAFTQVYDLKPLEHLTNLSTLDLTIDASTDRTNIIEDLGPLVGLTNLSKLVLRGNVGVRNLESLRHLTKLSELDLFRTRAENIEPLNGLRSLSKLDLSDTNVKDVEPLKELSNLSWLSLSGTQVDNIDSLKELKNLSSLDLTYSPVKDISPLKGLTNLARLDLTEALVDETSLKELRYANKNLRINQVRD